MPAMPPTSAVPPLRTLRRVTVVMHPSLGVSELMLYGQSYPAWSPFQSIAPPWSTHAHVVARRAAFATQHLHTQSVRPSKRDTLRPIVLKLRSHFRAQAVVAV